MPNIAISLGNVCHTAQWGVENGLRTTKQNGYKTCPFDLMVSNYDGIIACIADDFKYFCDPTYLVVNGAGIFNVKYNFGFNHESPGHADLYLHENWPEGTNHFINHNFKHFIERYNNRIQSFMQYLSDPNNYIVFMIQFASEANPNNGFAKLREVLALKYPNLKYTICLIPS